MLARSTTKPGSQNTRQAVAVDVETGEVLEGMPMMVSRRPRYVGEEYLLVFMGALKAIAMDRELTGESHRVLTYLIGTIGMKNEWSVLNQAEIAKELGIARPHINRSIQTLVRKGLIIKGARIGRGHAYSLNPAYGWRGGLKELADAQAEAPKLSLLRGGRDLHVE